MLDNDPTVWVGRNPAEALEFVLAGAAAERGAFGHNLDGSNHSDIAIWARGMGTAEHAQAQARLLLPSAQSRVEERLKERFPAVRRVMVELTAPLNTDRHGFYSNFTEALVMSADEVRKTADAA